MKKLLIFYCICITLLGQLIVNTNAISKSEKKETPFINQQITRNDYSVSKRIYDDANLFTDNEETKLNTKIHEIQNKYDIVVLIVTINDNLGYSTSNYANQFYDESLYGNEGILILYDMDEREIYILAVGEMMSVTIDDERREKILDDIWDDITDANYANAASTFLDKVSHYVKIDNLKGFERVTYALSSSIIFIPIVLIVSGIITLLIYVFSGRSGSLVKSKQYLKNGQVILVRQDDRFLHSHTTSRYVPPPPPQSNGGSGRSSSGGGSSTPRSGGGRKF